MTTKNNDFDVWFDCLCKAIKNEHVFLINRQQGSWSVWVVPQTGDSNNWVVCEDEVGENNMVFFDSRNGMASKSFVESIFWKHMSWFGTLTKEQKDRLKSANPEFCKFLEKRIPWNLGQNQDKLPELPDGQPAT